MGLRHEPPAPWLKYTGLEAQAGKPVTLAARAATGPDGAGVPGLHAEVHARRRRLDATAVTDANGVASVEVTLAAGTKYFSVKFDGERGLEGVG